MTDLLARFKTVTEPNNLVRDLSGLEESQPIDIVAIGDYGDMGYLLIGFAPFGTTRPTTWVQLEWCELPAMWGSTDAWRIRSVNA